MSTNEQNAVTEALTRREASRRELLRLKQDQVRLEELAIETTRNSAANKRAIAAESRRLTELTTKCAQLLHSDLAGVIGAKIAAGSPALTDEPVTTGAQELTTTADGTQYEACVL
jgi:hypothetical protein